MSNASLGSLVVSLEANVAKFTSDLGRAAEIADQRMRQIDKSIGIVKTSLGVLGAGFLANASFDKIKEKIEGAISSTAGLKELSERTGASAEALSGLSAVAKISNTDTETLATGLQKLSKNMVDAANGGAKTTSAFSALGISTADIASKKPEDIFLKIAQQQDKYADGAGKVAAIQNLLGKSGANLIPVLKDLALVGEYQVKVTQDQIDAAYEYEKNTRRLQASSNAIYKVIALEAVPALNIFTKALLDAQNESGGLADRVKGLAKEGSLREFFQDAAIEVAKFVDLLITVKAEIDVVVAGYKLAKSTISSGLKFGKSEDFETDEYKKQVEERARLAKAYEEATDKFLNGSTKYEDKVRKGIKEYNARIAKGGTEKNDKPNLDVSGLSGTKDDSTKKILEGMLKEQDAYIAAEKAQLQTREQYLQYYYQLEYTNAQDYYGTKQKLIAESLTVTLAAYDKEIAALNAYIDTAAKGANREEARNKRIEVVKKRAAAEVEANKQITDSVLQMDAMYRQFDLATTEWARHQQKSNDLFQYETVLMGESTLEIAKLTAARRIDMDVQERIYQMKKKDPNADVSKEVARALEEADNQKVRASALIEERFKKERDGWFGASEAIRKYAEEASNTGAQIEGSLTNAFKGAEDAFVKFATTGKLSFSGLAQSIIADLVRIQARKAIAGIIDMAIGAFSGNGNGNMDESGASFSATGADVAGRRAAGGPVEAGKSYVVGEKGQEIFTPSSAGAIIPNDRAFGGGAPTVEITQHIQVDSRTDQASIMQAMRAAKDAAKAEIMQSMRNGGTFAQLTGRAA